MPPKWFKDNLIPVLVAGFALSLGVGGLVGYSIGHSSKLTSSDSSESGSAIAVSASPVNNGAAETPDSNKFTPIDLSGSGQQATKSFRLPAGGYKFTLTYDGTDHFDTWLLDDQGKDVELLANQSGQPLNISKVVNVTDGNYSFNVGTDMGNWTIKIEAL